MIHIQFKQFTDIADFVKWVEIKPIDRGRSDDLKYYIQRTNGDEILLRVNDISRYEKAREAAIFAYSVYEKTGINMNVPIEVGACNDDKLVYTMYSWVNGSDAYERIRNLHIPLQYRYGISAGRLLRRIHSIPAPANIMPWEYYYSKKIDDYINRFNSYGHKFKGSDLAVKYLQNNKHLLVDRPMCALHGDFYTGNLVIDDNGSIGVIDFNQWKWGDPYCDFQSIYLSDTRAFMKGQIEGYFEGESVPPDFFPHLLYYNAAKAISSVIEANAFGEEAVEEAVKTSEKIVSTSDGFQSLIPDWYR